jgi:NAD(P)-dependent dehydrogenase (short-subunit alcohol dehydrogenase family)
VAVSARGMADIVIVSSTAGRVVRAAGCVDTLMMAGLNGLTEASRHELLVENVPAPDASGDPASGIVTTDSCP